MPEYEIAHDPQTGEEFVRLPGANSWQPATRDQVNALEEGGLEAFMRSAASSAELALRGAEIVAGEALGADMAEQRGEYGQLQGVQQMRQAGSPYAATGGALAPDVVIGALTAGTGGIASQVGRAAVVEGLLGAARSPDAPLRGAVVQGSLGAVGAGTFAGAGAISRGTSRGIAMGNSVVDAARSRGARAALEVGRRLPGVGRVVDDVAEGLSTSAARRTEARAMQSINAAAAPDLRYRPNLMTEDELADYAGGYFPELPPSMRAKLNARNSDDYVRANEAIAEQQARESVNPGITEALIAGERESITGAQSELQEITNRVFMREIGANADEFPDKAAMGQNLQRLNSELNANRGTRPVDAAGLGDEIDEIGRDRIMTQDMRDATDQVKKWVDDLSDDSGRMHPDDAATLQNRLVREIQGAANRDADVKVTSILADVEAKIHERLKLSMTPEQLARDAELRRQWGWTMSALNRQAALGERGVNISSLVGSRGSGAKGRSVRTRRSGDSLVPFLDTMKALTERARPQTGQTLSRRGLPPASVPE